MIILHSVFWYHTNELITTKQNRNDKYLLRITQFKISPGIWQHGRERRRWTNQTCRRGIKMQRDRNDVTQLNGEGVLKSGLTQYSHAVPPVYWEYTVNIQLHALCTFTHSQYCSTVVLCLSEVCLHVSCDSLSVWENNQNNTFRRKKNSNIDIFLLPLSPSGRSCYCNEKIPCRPKSIFPIDPHYERNISVTDELSI